MNELLVGVRVHQREESRLRELLRAMQANKPGMSVDDALDEIFSRGIAYAERVYTEGERND